MTRVLFCTGDVVGIPTGGGQVTKNEIEALAAAFTKVIVLGRNELRPWQYQGHDIPFLDDFFALAKTKGELFDLVHVYSGTFSQTIAYHKEQGSRITVTCPAHDRRESISEFQVLGLSYPHPHIQDDYLWGLMKQGLLWADTVIAPSSLSKRFLEAEGCKNVEIIPHGHGVPMDGDAPPFPSEFRVGYLGAVGPDKGVIYLIRAWGGRVGGGGDLVLAGAGTEALEPLIRREVDGGRFVLLGHVPSVADFFKQVSVYVQPSVSESFGIEVLEAMAHGRPVVVSDGAGASDVVRDGVDGFVVPSRNPEEIALKIAMLQEEPELLASMGKAAYEHAKGFTWERVKRQYVELFRRLHAPVLPSVKPTQFVGGPRDG